MRLMLIRHGDLKLDTDAEGRKLIYNADVPGVSVVSISELGIHQMEILGRKLVHDGLVPTHLRVSPYLRTRQSAAVLASQFPEKVPQIIDHDLRDVYAPGYIGVDLEHFAATIWGDIYALPPLTPDQESLEDLCKRASRVVRRIRDVDPEDFVGIVSHGDFLGALGWVLTNDPETYPETYKEMQDNFKLEKAEAHLFEVETSSGSIEGGRRIRTDEVGQSIETWRV